MSFITYMLMGLMPGDPLDIACNANPKCDPKNVVEMKKALGLDRPSHERFFIWAKDALQGDLGFSRTYRKPVTEIIGERLVNTFILGSLAAIISVFIAIPLGIYAGTRPRSKADYGINFLCFLGVSSPSFWLALMLIYVFAVWLQILPAGGVSSIQASAYGFGPMIVDRIVHLILPVTALSALTIAQWLRHTRSSMMDVMSQDYMRTARAKGLSWSQAIKTHGVKNALLPVVTVVALGFSIVFSGAVITETVFSYQGIGKLMYDSILANDYNVAMCAFVISCTAVLMANFVADILYGVLDPRIKLK